MTKASLLISRTSIRSVGVGELRAKLDELQRMSDEGDRRQVVYDTYIAISTEIERRKLKANAKPDTLISRGAIYLMKAGDIREKIKELLQREQTDVVRNTVVALSEELGRRSELAKRTYARRKGEAKQFMEGASA